MGGRSRKGSKWRESKRRGGKKEEGEWELRGLGRSGGGKREFVLLDIKIRNKFIVIKIRWYLIIDR